MRITCAVRPAPQAFMVNPMFEFLIGILTHTPVWVWVLFIFLVSRGLNARKPATVTLEKLAIIPAIFLIWDIYDLVVYRDLTRDGGPLGCGDCGGRDAGVCAD